LSEANASLSQKTWAEVSFSASHLLHEGVLVNPIKNEYLLMVLCPIKRPVITLDCVLLKDKSLVFTVELRPEISFRACLWVLTRPNFRSSLRPRSPHRAPTDSTLHLSSTLLLSLKFPSKRTLHQFHQWGPYGERCPFPEPSFTNRSEPRKNKQGLLIK